MFNELKYGYFRTGFSNKTLMYHLQDENHTYEQDDNQLLVGAYCEYESFGMKTNSYYKVAYTGSFDSPETFKPVYFEEYFPLEKEWKYVEFISGIFNKNAMYFDCDLLPHYPLQTSHNEFDGTFAFLDGYEFGYPYFGQDFNIENSTRYFMIYVGEFSFENNKIVLTDDFEIIDVEKIEDDIEKQVPEHFQCWSKINFKIEVNGEIINLVNEFSFDVVLPEYNETTIHVKFLQILKTATFDYAQYIIDEENFYSILVADTYGNKVGLIEDSF